MYTCKICNKSFELQRAFAGHAKIHKKSKTCISYETNPKLCAECNEPISFSSYTNSHKIKFCSCSCRANNLNKKVVNSIKNEETR